MKKVLVLSLLLAGVCFGEESVAAHEQKMKQMQEKSGKGAMNVERERNKENQEEKKRYQYENKYQQGKEKSEEFKMNDRNSAENDFKGGGSRGGGGGKK